MTEKCFGAFPTTLGTEGILRYRQVIGAAGFEPAIPRLRDYEPEETRLSYSFFGTGGTLRTFQEASVSRIGGLMGVCLGQPVSSCFLASDWTE